MVYWFNGLKISALLWSRKIRESTAKGPDEAFVGFPRAAKDRERSAKGTARNIGQSPHEFLPTSFEAAVASRIVF